MIRYGVAQGSELGFLLFLIYINDMCDIEIKGKIFTSADDTVIFCQADNWEEVFIKAEKSLSVLQKISKLQ